MQLWVGASFDRFRCANDKSSKSTLNALRFLQHSRTATTKIIISLRCIQKTPSTNKQCHSGIVLRKTLHTSLLLIPARVALQSPLVCRVHIDYRKAISIADFMTLRLQYCSAQRSYDIAHQRMSHTCTAQQLTPNSQGDNYHKNGHWMPPESPR